MSATCGYKDRRQRPKLPQIMPEDIPSILDSLNKDDVSKDEVLRYLNHEAALVRANAIEAAARLAKEDGRLVEVIALEAQKPQNSVRLLGTTTIRHLAIGWLLRVGIPEAAKKAAELLDAVPEEERRDLIWYLRSEGVL